MKTDKSDTLRKKLISELEKNRGLISISCKKVGGHRIVLNIFYHVKENIEVMYKGKKSNMMSIHKANLLNGNQQ